MKFKRQTQSKTDDEDSSKDDFKADDDTQSCNSNSKKSCQGCDLPSDDVPDSTSNSRGQNNNTPSATNNNQSNVNERTNGAISRTTPNSTIDLGTTQNTQNLMNSTSISNADSSIPSTGSLDEEEETPVKIKKKEETHSGGRKKKEPKVSHMYANNDVYRKENVQSPHVIGAKSNLNYNRNNNQYQNQVKIKGQPIAMQDGYFPGFYGKHPPPPNIHHQPNDVMFTKHEIEFHQKNMSTSQQQQATAAAAVGQQFPPFHGAVQKYDIHEYEQQHHNLLKNDVNHKISVGNIHSARPPPLDFPSPQNAQMYYSENNAQNSHNQYYPNEFDIGNDGANSVTGNGNGSGNGGTGSGYFDPKSQAHYYEMNYHHQHSGNDYSEMYVPNAVTNENCENFSSFQQYYDHHQHPQHPAQQQQPQNMHHPHPPHHYPHHIAAAAAAQQNLTNPVATAYVHQQNFASNAQIHGNTNLTENSNSSSDFNFLSNLNDFAPEYYQLS
ncbi:hypothetical protein ACKWTF_010584 [Chironomus riparius]